MTGRVIGAPCYPGYAAISGKEDARSFANSQWMDLVHRGSDKKIFLCCLDSNDNLLYLRAIQGHSGGTMVDPLLLDALEWTEYLYHVGCSRTMHSSRIYRRWKIRQRKSSIWKVTQDAIYWISSRKAQDKRSTFWKTRSHAVVLLPPGANWLHWKKWRAPSQTRCDLVSKNSDSTIVSKNGIERSLAKYNAMINRSDVPASGNRSRKRKDSRSTSEFQESHVKQHSKMQEDELRWCGNCPDARQAYNIRVKLIIFTSQSRTSSLITDMQKTDTLQPIQRRVQENHL